MSDRFVVEADRRIVGIAVKVPGGFQFFCSDENYRSLENQTFPRARVINACVAGISRTIADQGSAVQ